MDMAEVASLEQWRMQRAATLVDHAVAARSELRGAAHEFAARRACELLATIEQPEARRVYVLAVSEYVWALQNRGATDEADSVAGAAYSAVASDEPHWVVRTLGGSKAPLYVYQMELVHLRAMMLAQDPQEAAQRALALTYRFRKEGSEDARLWALDAVKTVIIAGVRAGDTRRVEAAVTQGEHLVTALRGVYPLAAGGLLHRAGCALSRQANGTCQRATDMLRDAQTLRQAGPPRDRKTLGMTVGEWQISRGEIDEGVATFHTTLLALRDDLPRHFASAVDMMQARGLPIPVAA